jgi:outer membrane receptor protein involved in Fe transport
MNSLPRLFWAVVLLLAAAAQNVTAQNQGTVAGTVFDATSGRPIPLVQVAVDGIADARIQTDSSGRYVLKLSPGTYRISFSADNYIDSAITEVVVKADELTDASTVMQQKGAVTSVDVVEKVGAVESNSESILVERKLAVTVSDAISKDDIRNSTASDAAGALEKVTGISIVDNGYVYVRGLGERYSATMLNNAIIPTTEPERRVVPLDLFPANLIDNIKVLKTYSADLPGEFSGGLVQMNTVEFPTQKVLQVSLNYGFNSQVIGQDFMSFSGGSRDFFGFGRSSRELPSIIPRDERLIVGRFTEQQFQEFGRAFPVEYSPVMRSGRPQQSYSVVAGNTFGKLGLVGALTFNNTPSRTPQLYRFLANQGGGRAGIFSQYDDFNVDNESARLGAVFNAAYRLTAAQKLVFRTTLTRDSDKEARIFRGLNGSINVEVEDSRLRYVERTLASTSLEGDHAFASLKNSIFHWQMTYSLSGRDEPDLRQVIRGREDSSSPYRFLNLGDSGFRFFNELRDKIYEPTADWGLPFFKGNISGLVKFGYRGTFRQREFDARRFRFQGIRLATVDLNAPNDVVLGLPNIRPDGFAVREVTRGTDAYDGDMTVHAGYGMVDLNLGAKWRAVFGLRIEDANITVETVDPLAASIIPVFTRLANRDLLPGLNLIYALKPRQNLRFGYSRTVNRPDFRELSPFEFTNIVGGFTTVGNPGLSRALIDNFDARWEFFPGGNQVVAASYFYKRFTNPIEQIYRPTASELRQSFLNVDSATNQGVEFEWRYNLGNIKRMSALRDFALQSNLTVVNSSVGIPVERFPQLTSRERPLVGQSRFIYNIIADWSKPRLRSTARFFVNSVSRRLTDVGTFQLPDVYQERNTFLDFVYQYNIRENGKWTLRFSAENLSDNNYRYTQADFLVRSFRIGRTFTIGTSYTFF